MKFAEITIDQHRNIDSIELKLTDELIQFLQGYGGTPPDGAPSVFMFRELGIKTKVPDDGKGQRFYRLLFQPNPGKRRILFGGRYTLCTEQPVDVVRIYPSEQTGLVPGSPK